MTDLFQFVQKYHQYGYVCIPVNVGLNPDGSKKPQFPQQYKQRRFDDPADWEGYTGIAVNTGMSGVVAIDLDRKVDGSGNIVKDGLAAAQAAGIQIPDSPITATTQSGGKHRLFRAGNVPVPTLSGEPVEGVDTRGVGGVLFVYPTMVGGDPDRAYTWDRPLCRVDDLPEIPTGFAELVSSKTVEVIEAPEDFTPADCTPAQREYAQKKIGYKLADLAAAGDGQRWAAQGQIVRIVGLAKTIGEDLEVLAKEIRAAYTGSKPEQVEYSIRSALRNAKLEDPRSWPTADFSPVGFWDSRPELRHIYDAAFSRGACPWAVLGVVVLRVLALVPPSWQSFSDARGTGNFNLFLVIAGASGAGKGQAHRTGRDLLPFTDDEVKCRKPASGEGIPMMFTDWDRSVIIDVPEYGALAASADRPGSTLIPTLCSAFSGESLGDARADVTRNVFQPEDSYRLGFLAGVQYGNAGLLLAPRAVVTGLPQRFIWLPANADESEAPQVRPDWPGELPRPLLPSVGGFTGPGEVARKLIRLNPAADSYLQKVGDDQLFGRGNLSEYDAHRLYARQKFAYGLALLNGHTESIRESDWELAGMVLRISDATRQKAFDALRDQDRKRQEAAGKRDAVRKDSAESAYSEMRLERAAGTVERFLRKRPHGATRGETKKSLASGDRCLFDDAIDWLIAAGRVTTRDEDYFLAL